MKESQKTHSVEEQDDSKWTIEDTIDVILGFLIIAVFIAIAIAGFIFIATHAPSKIYLPWHMRIEL